MGGDVLQIFGFSAVDITREIQVEIVSWIADLGQGHHSGISGNFHLAGEGVDNSVNVLFAKPVLGSIFAKPFTGIDHEDALAGRGVLFVEHQNAGRYAGPIEQVGRQADDALEIAGADEIATDDGLGIAPEEDAWGRMQAPLPVLLRDRMMCSRKA